MLGASSTVYLQPLPIDFSEQHTEDNTACYRGFDLHAALEGWAITLTLIVRGI